jgi:hypothetical protein
MYIGRRISSRRPDFVELKAAETVNITERFLMRTEVQNTCNGSHSYRELGVTEKLELDRRLMVSDKYKLISVLFPKLDALHGR